MLWKEIKTWAKDQGYKADRSKIDDEAYLYKWHKIDDPSINGEANSVSKLATAVFNDITGNIHLEHQKQYKLNLENIKHESGF